MPLRVFPCPPVMLFACLLLFSLAFGRLFVFSHFLPANSPADSSADLPADFFKQEILV